MTIPPLKERESAVLDLTPDQAAALDRIGLKVEPAPYGRWKVDPGVRVGAVRVGDVELRIQPKVNIRRLLFLMGFAARDRVKWQEDDIAVAADDGLVPVMAVMFVRAAKRALADGPPYGYRRVDAALQTVRGRWRVGDQIRHRHGIAPPVEVTYQDHTSDIPETRLLIAATRRLLALPDVPDDARRELRRLLRWLPTGTAGPWRRRDDWARTRANARFHLALDLADLIVADDSVELRDGVIHPDGFLVNMQLLFQDFVQVALAQHLRPYGGAVRGKHPDHRLDEDKQAALELDVGWYFGDRVVALADAKYMSSRHNSELYQQLAYCTALGVPRAHLIYAAGAHPRTTYRVRNTTIEIVRHTLDLEQDIDGLRTQLAAIGDELVQDAAAADNPNPVAASSGVR